MIHSFRLLFIISIAMVTFQNSNAQTNTFPTSGSAGIGTATPNASSILDIVSTTKGVLFPRMTQAQRNAILSPATGLLIYQTTNTPGLYYYSGTAWTAVKGASKNLNNLTAPTAVNVNLLPNANNTVDLGSSANSWKNFYSDGNIYMDDMKFISNAGGSTFLGVDAGNSNQATGNVGVGYGTLYSNINGSYNTATGAGALYLSGGDNNTACGTGALGNITLNSGNTACGFNAGYNAQWVDYCSFLGAYADVNVAADFFAGSTALGQFSTITGSSQVRIGHSGSGSIGGYSNWTNLSDGRYKKNVKENVPGLEFINQLKPITYTLDVNGISEFLGEDKRASSDNESNKKLMQQGRDEKSKIVYSGFIAQDVEAAANRIGYDFSGVDKPQNEHSLYGLRYAEFVVPLVKAVQELDSLNKDLLAEHESLKMENSALDKRITKLESLFASQLQMDDSYAKLSIQNSSLNTPVLGQNVPNPFDNSSLIPLRIPKDCADASIMIVETATGKVVSVIPVSCNETHLSIEAGSLASGTYAYTLYVDGKQIDTKQMVVTK